MSNKKSKRAKTRESKLIAELCAKHGYMMQDARKSDRHVWTWVKKPKPHVDLSYKLILIVPSDSALGEQFAKRYSKGSDIKAKLVKP